MVGHPVYAKTLSSFKFPPLIQLTEKKKSRKIEGLLSLERSGIFSDFFMGFRGQN